MAKRKSGPKKTRIRVKRRKIDWVAIKMRWIAENMDPTRDTPYTYVICAKDFKINEGNLRTRAAEGDWKGELRAQKARLISETTGRTRKHYAELENKLRDRQANLGRLMQTKGAIKIQSIEDPVKELSLKDAMEISRHGAEMERKARGVPDRIDIHANLEVEETSGYESPEAKIARLQKEERQRDSFYEMFVEGGRDDSEAA